MRIRVAEPSRDAPRIAEIYRPYVEGTVVSFEDVAPSPSEIAARMTGILDWTPWLVAVDADDRTVGYAYASRHRERAGYRWSVDISVYVEESSRGRGVGRALYADLLPILRRQQFVNAYAGIGLPNEASVALHKSIGMSLVGVYEKVGWKLGEWVDVAWYELRLGEPIVDGSAPHEPIPFRHLEPDAAS
jgi:L-amino acid N-acyltransferase YncA